MLIGAALMNGLLEEIVMIGFWFVRGRQLNWPVWVVLVSSAVVRGSYHLYQGFGGFVGNIVMGLVFGLAYLKFKRVGPLVVAHVILDLFVLRRLLPARPARRLALAVRSPATVCRYARSAMDPFFGGFGIMFALVAGFIALFFVFVIGAIIFAIVKANASDGGQQRRP